VLEQKKERYAAMTQQEMYDLVLLNRQVMDPETQLDALGSVGIQQGKISAVSREPLAGREVIDATGLVVAPGFIDLHTHGQTTPSMRMQAFDGVTTALELEAGSLPIGLAYDVAAREGRPLNYGFATSWVALAFLVFFSSLLAFSAYGYLLGHVRPALATNYAYVNPVVAVALGSGLAGEHMTLLGILAMFVILSGVRVVSLAKQPKKPGHGEERSRGSAASFFEFPQSDQVVRHHVKLAGEKDDDESKGAGSGRD
jgi:hypothetical protein